jgi:hypothetical protein
VFYGTRYGEGLPTTLFCKLLLIKNSLFALHLTISPHHHHLLTSQIGSRLRITVAGERTMEGTFLAYDRFLNVSE